MLELVRAAAITQSMLQYLRHYMLLFFRTCISIVIAGQKGVQSVGDYFESASRESGCRRICLAAAVCLHSAADLELAAWLSLANCRTRKTPPPPAPAKWSRPCDESPET